MRRILTAAGFTLGSMGGIIGAGAYAIETSPTSPPIESVSPVHESNAAKYTATMNAIGEKVLKLSAEDPVSDPLSTTGSASTTITIKNPGYSFDITTQYKGINEYFYGNASISPSGVDTTQTSDLYLSQSPSPNGPNTSNTSLTKIHGKAFSLHFFKNYDGLWSVNCSDESTTINVVNQRFVQTGQTGTTDNPELANQIVDTYVEDAYTIIDDLSVNQKRDPTIPISGFCYAALANQ